jgi:hypothetical protein
MSHFQSQSASFKDVKDADVFPKKLYLALERRHSSLVIHVFGVFGVFQRHQRRQRLTVRFADVVGNDFAVRVETSGARVIATLNAQRL